MAKEYVTDWLNERTKVQTNEWTKIVSRCEWRAEVKKKYIDNDIRMASF